MSEANYRRLESIGVTGRSTDTCFVACVDILSPDYDIPAPTYQHYDQMVEKLEDKSVKVTSSVANRMFAESFDLIAKDLELDSHEDLTFERADTAHDLSLLLRKHFRQAEPVILDVDVMNSPYGRSCNYYGVHAVGVVPVSVNPEAFKLTSTWLPPELKGVMTVDELFPHLTHHGERPIKKYGFNDANVTCLTPTKGFFHRMRHAGRADSRTRSHGAL